MEEVIITEKSILSAKRYIPLATKEKWAAENAQKCFDRLAITADGEAMPPMYMVNTGLRSRYLMAALAGMYFGFEYETDETDEQLMSETDYDKYAGSHIINQIERLKANYEVRDECFDLLYDYHDLEKRFGNQINGLLNIQNDYVLRQGEVMSAQIKDLPGIVEQLKKLQEAKADGETA